MSEDRAHLIHSKFSSLRLIFSPPPNGSSASGLPDMARWQRDDDNDRFAHPSQSSYENEMRPEGMHAGLGSPPPCIQSPLLG